MKKILTLPLKPFKNLWNRFKPLSWKKKTAVIVITLIILIVARGQYARLTAPPKYQTEAARFDSVTEIVSETGNVTSAGAAEVYSTTKGIVQEVYVENGSLVSAGDTLFKVKATATKQERDAALSAYQTAKNTLESAKSDQLSIQADMFAAWDNFKTLAESDSYEEDNGTPKYYQRALPEFHISEKDWLAAEADYKNQQQVISQAATNASAKWAAYQETVDSEVKATIDGEIRNLSVATGDLVAVPTTLTLASTTPALLILDGSVNTMVKLDIGETDAIKVKPGQPATVEIDAIPDKTFAAHVDRVDTLSTPTDGVVNFSVYVALDESDESIRAGLTADADITVASRDNVLTVPNSAVKPYEGGRAVRTVGRGEEIVFVPVEVGIKGAELTEIISGIEEGTEVITALSNDQVERSGPSFF